jgi:hypothetical protein
MLLNSSTIAPENALVTKLPLRHSKKSAKKVLHFIDNPPRRPAGGTTADAHTAISRNALLSPRQCAASRALPVSVPFEN